MASLRAVFPILTLIAVTLATQNLTTYMPECVQPCLQQTISSSSSGSCTRPEDSQCLCTNQPRIGYAALMCAQNGGACPGNSTEQLRSAMMAAYQQYCSDVGATGGWNSLGGFPAFTTSGMVIGPSGTTTSSSTTPPPTSTPTTVNDEPSSPGDSGRGNSSLSTGAIAGIAVGGGVAVISITGGLLLLAFRLGKGYSSRKKDDGTAGPGQQGGGEGGEGGSGDGGGAGAGGQLTGVIDEAATKNEAQLDGKPVSELQTEYTLSGFNPVRELAAQERPAELPADPLPRYVEDASPVLPDASWRVRGDHT
ncbi:hypothetical protein F5Y13DRAFT_13267 [Hypoxylon sp. FL1857]|nr:hypothetical protein F5Y13DRAFT_13267 [Hypoxylon sp. FL1857]